MFRRRNVTAANPARLGFKAGHVGMEQPLGAPITFTEIELTLGVVCLVGRENCANQPL